MTQPTFTSQAHPRAGGENEAALFDLIEARGSSPRGRGKPLFSFTTMRSTRLIPARAGKTVAVMRARSSSEAHPRAGGENLEVERRGPGWLGSSPRGRGKLVDEMDSGP